MNPLLTREEFKEQVFARDNGKCVACGSPGADAHHLIERRLFHDQGYYLDNGVTLCPSCHIKAEETTLSCEELRRTAGITSVVLPSHLYDDPELEYTKWGDIVLPNGNRVKGELFFDESVQKILTQGKVLDKYINHVKYPRTMHLPWSNRS